MSEVGWAPQIAECYRSLIEVARTDPRRYALGAAGFSTELEPQLAERLSVYLGLIKLGGEQVDLIAPVSDEELIERHLIDCLAASRLLQHLAKIPSELSYVDVGAGAGLPGVVLALAEPTRKVFLIEPREKRAQFLLNLQEKMGLENVEVLKSRFERLTHEQIPNPGVFTARALGEEAKFLAATDKLLSPGGVTALMVGPNWAVPPGWQVERLYYRLPRTKREFALALVHASSESRSS